MTESTLQAALQLLDAGFSPVPCGTDKAPKIKWAHLQQKPMTEEEARRHFVNGAWLGIIGGSVSGNLEALDFDDPALFLPFLDLLDLSYPGLRGKLTWQRKTLSGGYHIIYRSTAPISGNVKLACKAWVDDGKKREETLIETRGEGGLFVTTPTPGYSIMTGGPETCSVLTPEEVEALHATARAFDLRESEEEKGHKTDGNSEAPGAAFNRTTNIPDILQAKGWKPARRTTLGPSWTRPGKEIGVSGVLLDQTGNFYVWSSNAFPLEPRKSYSPFGLYAYFEHDGDFSAAARQLARDGFGTPSRGEGGERGENKEIASKATGRKPGESGRILSEEQIKAFLDAAKKTDALLPVTGSAPSYPVESLGGLAEVCKAIVEEGQVSPEMAGQCLLGTAALLVQSMADVRTLAGIKPLSLYLQTMAESGEGKSTAEEAALRPVVEKQRADGQKFREAVKELQRMTATRKKADGPTPPMPTEPYRIMKDGTVEGIRRAFKEGLPSQGCFTSEAAVMLGGYGMSAEHRGKTAGNLNGLWDCGEISVARGTEGRLQLYDRRMSIHWLIQPDIAYQAIHDPMLSSVGFWPRFLLACPAPTPPLRAKIFRPGNHRPIIDFWERCRGFLSLPLGEACSELPVIAATEEANKMACRFYEKMQIEGKRGKLMEIRPFALRATEQAFRIAGVLSVFFDKQKIDADTMRNGITLASYSLDSWLSVFGSNDENAGRNWALALYEWLLKQRDQKATTTAMLRLGPKSLRSKDRRDTALSLLQQAGLVDNDRDSFFAFCEGV